MIDFVITSEIPDAAYSGFGQQMPRTKSLQWPTEIVRKDDGSEQRNQVRSKPERRWNLNWQWMDEAARNKLIEIFHRARGSYNTFKLEDWDDYSCGYDDWSYTAVGAETTLQLQKTYYVGEAEEWSENRTVLQPASVYPRTIKIDGVLMTEGVEFTLGSTGIIDFTGGTSPNGALGAAEVVTANYQFYFEVRFDFDTYEDEMHYVDYWKTNGVSLIEVTS